jgi:hypothetical protein
VGFLQQTYSVSVTRSIQREPTEKPLVWSSFTVGAKSARKFLYDQPSGRVVFCCGSRITSVPFAASGLLQVVLIMFQYIEG